MNICVIHLASYEKLNQSIPVYTIVAEVLRILIKRRFCDFEFEHCANKNSLCMLLEEKPLFGLEEPSTRKLTWESLNAFVKVSIFQGTTVSGLSWLNDWIIIVWIVLQLWSQILWLIFFVSKSKVVWLLFTYFNWS